MKETEIKALIRLLDDDDPNVFSHVTEKLLSMGGEILPRLENAWEHEADEVLQERIEDMIALIQSQGTRDRLRAWREAGASNLLEGWYLLTQFQYPEIRFESYKHMISRLVNRTWLEIRQGMNPVEKLRLVNRMLFSAERFRGNKKTLFDPQSYFLNTFMESQVGSPLSLGMLYLILCESLEIPLKGLILPNYFVLKYQDEQQTFFVDVFNKGKFFLQDDLDRYLQVSKVEQAEQFKQPVDQLSILRMLVEMLIQSFQRKKDTEKVEALQHIKAVLTE